MGKGRIEAFSDGVFAIAITLLVLTIPNPTHYRHLGSALANQWPAYAAYLVSFAVIGIMWLNHHTVFGHFERVDRNLVYLNLALLATVVFVPYPTGVFGEALQRGHGERVASRREHRVVGRVHGALAVDEHAHQQRVVLVLEHLERVPGALVHELRRQRDPVQLLTLGVREQVGDHVGQPVGARRRREQ